MIPIGILIISRERILSLHRTLMMDVEILDISFNYLKKRATNIVYDDSLPSLSK